MSDRELSDLVTYIRSLPPVNAEVVAWKCRRDAHLAVALPKGRRVKNYEG